MCEYMKLIAMEQQMEQNDFTALFEEGGGDLLITVGAKVGETIKKIYAQMVAFAQEIGASITAATLKIKLDTKMNMLRKKIASGESVTCPDFAAIVKEFKKDVVYLRKEIQATGKMLDRVGANNAEKIDKYLTRKNYLEEDIADLLEDFQKVCKKRITIDPAQGEREAQQVASKASLLVSEYTKLTEEIQKLGIRFNKMTRIAEAGYDARVISNISTNRLHKIQTTSTKCLRNGVFAILSFIV